MKRNTLSSIAIAVTILALTSCKAKKAALPPVPASHAVTEASTTKAELIKRIQAKQPVFSTLSIKARGELKLNNNSSDVNMSIRIKNGEAIWISVSMIIEGARALITPDSIKIMDRLNSEYTRKPFSYIHQFTSKQIDFNAVQGLFTANALPGSLNQRADITTKEGQIEIKGTLSDLFIAMLFNGNDNLVQNSVTDESNSQNLNVNYADFGIIKALEIPQTVNINSIANNKKISATLKYSAVTVDEPVDFPFNVPKRYTVKD